MHDPPFEKSWIHPCQLAFLKQQRFNVIMEEHHAGVLAEHFSCLMKIVVEMCVQIIVLGVLLLECQEHLTNGISHLLTELTRQNHSTN